MSYIYMSHNYIYIYARRPYQIYVKHMSYNLIASRIPAGPRLLGFWIPCFHAPLFSSISVSKYLEHVQMRFRMGFGGFMGPFASPGGSLGSCLGLLRAPWGPRWVLTGASRSQKSSQDAPKSTKDDPRTRKSGSIGPVNVSEPPRSRSIGHAE